MSRPYVIAEVGVNHEGSLDTAVRMIDAAHRGGADAVKFQTYKADLLAAVDSPAYWDTTQEPTASQHELFKKHDSFGPAEFEALAAHAHTIGIDFLSTPFDDGAVDLLDTMVPFFKIASADITNVQLLSKIASKGKPVVLSTGASNADEISFAVDVLSEGGAAAVVLLHCVLNYPTPDASAHLRMIQGLQEAWPHLLVGLSDHTVPGASPTPLLLAYALGAAVIEKHFTLDKSLPGNDHYHSMDEEDLRITVQELRRAEALMGRETEKVALESEHAARNFARRSLVARGALRAGQTVAERDLIPLRPATGIPADQMSAVVGAVVARDIAVGAILQWEDLVPQSAPNG